VLYTWPQFDYVMNFSWLAGTCESSKNDSGHTLPDGDGITDLEPGLTRAANNDMP
jgi:hypothetical protein